MQRTPTSFYDALPSRKMELYEGKFLVGGSIEKTAMAMSFVLEAYGAGYAAAQWIPNDVLQEALIEVYGNPNQNNALLADYTPVEQIGGWSQLKTHLRLSFFQHKHLITMGPDLVMRLDKNAWTPDIMILHGADREKLSPYYVDGAASLLVEFVNPATLTFDNGDRLAAYAQGGIPEIWRIDEARKEVTQLQLIGDGYQSSKVTDEILFSSNIPTIKLQISKIWDNPMEAVEIESPPPSSQIALKEGLGWGSIPYAPRVALEPVPIQFEEYISWAGEAKFEFMPQPIFGGGNESTLQFLGLCMMTLGIKEVVKYLPAEEWSKVL